MGVWRTHWAPIAIQTLLEYSKFIFYDRKWLFLIRLRIAILSRTSFFSLNFYRVFHRVFHRVSLSAASFSEKENFFCYKLMELTSDVFDHRRSLVTYSSRWLVWTWFKCIAFDRLVRRIEDQQLLPHLRQRSSPVITSISTRSPFIGATLSMGSNRRNRVNNIDSMYWLSKASRKPLGRENVCTWSNRHTAEHSASAFI